MELERLEAELQRKKQREEAETITSEVLTEIVEIILKQIDAEHAEDLNFIRRLVTDEVVDKVGDRFTADFKNFLIDELVKRIPSDRDNNYYADMSYEDDNFSDELFEDDYNVDLAPVAPPTPFYDDQETLVSWEIEERQAKKAATEEQQ